MDCVWSAWWLPLLTGMGLHEILRMSQPQQTKVLQPRRNERGVTLNPDFGTMRAASISKCLRECPKYWIWQWLNNHSEKHSYHPVNDQSQNCFLNSPLILYQLCSHSGFVLLPQSPNAVLPLCAGPCYETCYTSFQMCVYNIWFFTQIITHLTRPGMSHRRARKQRCPTDVPRHLASHIVLFFVPKTCIK